MLSDASWVKHSYVSLSVSVQCENIHKRQFLNHVHVHRQPGALAFHQKSLTERQRKSEAQFVKEDRNKFLSGIAQLSCGWPSPCAAAAAERSNGTSTFRQLRQKNGTFSQLFSEARLLPPGAETGNLSVLPFEFKRRRINNHNPPSYYDTKDCSVTFFVFGSQNLRIPGGWHIQAFIICVGKKNKQVA